MNGIMKKNSTSTFAFTAYGEQYRRCPTNSLYLPNRHRGTRGCG